MRNTVTGVAPRRSLCKLGESAVGFAEVLSETAVREAPLVIVGREE